MKHNKYASVSSATIWPSGVITPPNPGSRHNEWMTDTDISDLYKKVIEDECPVDMNLTIEVSKCAVKLIHNPDVFFQTQQVNGRLSDRLREYLHDTYNFICNGERVMSQHTWISLLADKSEPGDIWTERKGQISTHILPEGKVPKPGMNVIAEWLSQPNGCMDMLITLYVLFGSFMDDKCRHTLY